MYWICVRDNYIHITLVLKMIAFFMCMEQDSCMDKKRLGLKLSEYLCPNKLSTGRRVEELWQERRKDR